MRKLLLCLCVVINICVCDFVYAINHKVSVQLLWKHQFEFAGIYVAKNKGFYQEANLDVDIIPFDANSDMVQNVLQQKITFGIGYPSIILHGNDVVLLNAFFQSSPHIIVTTNPNIKNIKDFKNKTIMINMDAVKIAAFAGMLSSGGITFADLKKVKHQYNLDSIIHHKVDLMPMYMSNELYLLDKKNIYYKIFDPRDFGFDFYTDILFTSLNFVKQHPKEVAAFQKATIKGWLWAFEHIEESVDLILKYYNTSKTKDALLHEAHVLKNLAFYKTEVFGQIKASKLKEIYNTYYMLDIVKKDLNVQKLIFGFVYQEPIIPIPQHIEYNVQKAKLGKNLFFDTRLSADNTVSCATCHVIEEGGDDNAQFSTGIKGSLGHINSPTVLNARYNIAQFWDGRAKDLKEQVKGPIENPVEMGHSLEGVEQVLKRDHKLLNEFNHIYTTDLTQENIMDAIAEFEKTLITPNCQFDKYLRGDKTAITKYAQDGYNLFKKYGCINCHNGINIGGNLFQKVGIYPKFSTEVHNLGMTSLAGNLVDKFYFKVPSLRNICKTAPYFHTGDINSLERAVKIISYMQLGIVLSQRDTDKIMSFLQSLDGEYPEFMKAQTCE